MLNILKATQIHMQHRHLPGVSLVKNSLNKVSSKSLAKEAKTKRENKNLFI